MYLKKIANGMWVKYDCEPGNWSSEAASYNKLYEDLKNSDVEWCIAKSKEECMEQLCGELIPNHGTPPGDIYVYYLNSNESKIPIFYIHVYEYEDSWAKEKKNHIYFNGNSLGCDDIDNKYLPELITKLREIDEIKNEHYIEELETRYENYQRLLSLKEKTDYTEDDLLFLYYMAYNTKDVLAMSMIETRDINKDFSGFTDENKVKLFLCIRNSDISDKLFITSKDILRSIAQNGCLKQLNNASEEIIADKDYIMDLLECFYNSDKSLCSSFELEKYLPSKYKTDIDILEQIFYKYAAFLSSMIAWWIGQDQELSNNREFAYRLITSFYKALINRGEYYCENSLLWVFDDEILKDIENHILTEPESDKKREWLRLRILEGLEKDKKKVLNYRQCFSANK